ncbi:hypothetical protein SFHH103_02619 [Sinorhizobium fredii HH103]|uniref:Uncharacterized protein n=1 Tax=Sinorhizobium fredii (strain HH103) TaxID=1117943 RepID=G9AAL0_SINF1|nr:hypothetical protein SFHH103_02619 [Sinorhizobium fredii HH103]
MTPKSAQRFWGNDMHKNKKPEERRMYTIECDAL